MKRITLFLILAALMTGFAFADAPIDGFMAGMDATLDPTDGADAVFGVVFDISPTDMPLDFYAAIGISETYGKAGITVQPGKNNNFFGIYAGGGVKVNKQYKTISYVDGQVDTVTFYDTNLWFCDEQTQEVAFTDTDTDTFFNGYGFKGIGEVGIELDFQYVAFKVGYLYYAGDHRMNIGVLVGY